MTGRSLVSTLTGMFNIHKIGLSPPTQPKRSDNQTDCLHPVLTNLFLSSHVHPYRLYIAVFVLPVCHSDFRRWIGFCVVPERACVHARALQTALIREKRECRRIKQRQPSAKVYTARLRTTVFSLCC